MYKIHQFSWHCIARREIADVNLIKGVQNIFGGEFNTVIQLGIQAPSGTTFTINAEGINTSSIIEIGDTGIFELDFKESNTYITTLYLTAPSYLIDSKGKATDNFDIIVDILYEG